MKLFQGSLLKRGVIEVMKRYRSCLFIDKNPNFYRDYVTTIYAAEDHPKVTLFCFFASKEEPAPTRDLLSLYYDYCHRVFILERWNFGGGLYDSEDPIISNRIDVWNLYEADNRKKAGKDY